MKFKAITVALRQTADALQCAHFRPGLVAERIAAPVLQAPDAKGEPVFLRGSIKV